MPECQAVDDGTGWVKCGKCASTWLTLAWDRTWRPCKPGAVSSVVTRSLSDYTDEEIAREYIWRAQQKLGDPRIQVGQSVENKK